MGLVYANIELINVVDWELHRRGVIGEDEIRSITVQCMVDSGALMLTINEEIRAALDLPIIEQRPSRLADGTRVTFPVAGPVMTRFMCRICNTNAIVLPGENEALLGAIPMEEMDLYIHPAHNELAPVHPEGPVMSLK